MRTKVTIASIVLTISALVVAIGVAAAWLWGLIGFLIYVAAGLAIVATYATLVRPWQIRWGATDEEVERRMPGDDIIPGARSTTRAISIAAPPSEIWPWIKQLGYGRAGWYSYDWIDNDGRPSSRRIVPEYQQLEPQQQIVMVPGMGPVVREVVQEVYFVAGDPTTGTWCLYLSPDDGSTRLISRWRQDWKMTPLSAFWIAISDPGSFIMERKMLRGIKARAEVGRARSDSLRG